MRNDDIIFFLIRSVALQKSACMFFLSVWYTTFKNNECKLTFFFKVGLVVLEGVLLLLSSVTTTCIYCWRDAVYRVLSCLSTSEKGKLHAQVACCSLLWKQEWRCECALHVEPVNNNISVRKGTAHNRMTAACSTASL